jgi:hypothetical protein
LRGTDAGRLVDRCRGRVPTQAPCEPSTSTARIGLIFEEKDDREGIMEQDPYERNPADIRDGHK